MRSGRTKTLEIRLEVLSDIAASCETLVASPGRGVGWSTRLRDSSDMRAARGLGVWAWRAECRAGILA